MQNEDQWSGFELLWVLSEHLLKHLNVENGIVEGVITRLNPDGAVILPERPSLKPYAVQRSVITNDLSDCCRDLTGIECAASIRFGVVSKIEIVVNRGGG